MSFAIGYATGLLSMGLLVLAIQSVRRALRIWDEEEARLGEEG